MKKTLMILSLLSALPIVSCSSLASGVTTAIPSGIQLIKARQKNVAESSKQGYDFNIHLECDASQYGLEETLSGDYDASYRYNSEDDTLQFVRVSTGDLLHNQTKYIFSDGANKITLRYDVDGDIKKTKVESEKELDYELLNLPFEKFLDSVNNNELAEITVSETEGYQYQTTISAENKSEFIDSILSLFTKIGTKIRFKKFDSSMIKSDVTLLFNLEEESQTLTGFKLIFDTEFPVKGVTKDKVLHTLSYSQTLSDTEIDFPNQDSLITSKETIKQRLNTLSEDLTNIQNSTVYDIDVDYENATYLPNENSKKSSNSSKTKSQYKARLIKNNDIFNKSYAVSGVDESGASVDTKYVLGSSTNNGVVLADKNKNVIEQNVETDVNTQFNDLIDLSILPTSDDITYLVEETKNTKTTYYLYFNTSYIQNFIDNDIAKLTSNNLAINNFYNAEDVSFTKAYLKIVYKNNQLDEMKIETNVNYFPTTGEYQDLNLELMNKFEIEINDTTKASTYTLEEVPTYQNSSSKKSHSGSNHSHSHSGPGGKGSTNGDSTKPELGTENNSGTKPTRPNENSEEKTGTRPTRTSAN